jgi:hypothetical protein
MKVKKASNMLRRLLIWRVKKVLGIPRDFQMIPGDLLT